jgi:predicted transcriptional regulator
MKQITITVDKADWEDFYKGEKKMGHPGEDKITQCFQRNVNIAKETMQPYLKVVGKEEKPKDIKRTASNITRIGPQPITAYTDIELNIEDGLYEDIAWAAERRSISTAELANKWANDYIEICKPEVTEITKIFYEYLGLDIIKAVK